MQSVISVIAFGSGGAAPASTFTKASIRVLLVSGLGVLALLAPAPMGLAQSASVTTQSSLSAVTCTSANNCWAVGSSQFAKGNPANRALHWNGTSWSVVVALPGSAGKGPSHTLAQIACVSAQDCWAVGTYGRARGGQTVTLNQILHWNGTAWTVSKTPEPVSADGLNGVTCKTAANCWAVGVQRHDGASTWNEALHWNGGKWSLVRTPQPAGLHGGGEYSQVFNTLTAATCPSAANCWSVGLYEDTGVAPTPIKNEVLHWNGHKWISVGLPARRGTLGAVSCTSAPDCWAVGAGQKRYEFLHWNGAAWSTMSVSTGAFSALSGVRCTSRTNCWAVGQNSNSILTIFRWNGKAWSPTSIPVMKGTLNGVTCTSVGDCWTVGTDQSSGGNAEVILHWNGSQWRRESLTSTPS